MYVYVSLENKTPSITLVPSALECEWDLFRFEVCQDHTDLHTSMSPFNDLHCTVTACSAPAMEFSFWLSYYISFPSYFYWPLKSSGFSSQLPILSHFLGVHSQFPPSPLFTFWACGNADLSVSQIHTFHILITHFIFLFPLVLHMTSPPCSLHPAYYSIS